MPTISVVRDELYNILGKVYSEDEFNDLCFDFGLELDEVTSEKEMIAKEQGIEKAKNASDKVIYKIDVPANRYDLLCLEGLSQALMVFQEKMKAPSYKVLKTANGTVQQLIIKPRTAQVRPYAVGAVLRGINFTQEIYKSFIDLQDKLHQNIGRKRSLVAIGTHDLDVIKGPFVYDAEDPKTLKFVPLNQSKEFSAVELMELYSTDSHLRHYLHLIREEPFYPVIRDDSGVVLSMPPIINGNHSKITMDTKNVFIEITATDLNKACITLDTIICMFSKYCREPFSVEPVEVLNQPGSDSPLMYPLLPYRKMMVDVEKINGTIGISQPAEKLATLLTKMCLTSKVIDGGKRLEVEIPPSRHDIIHACDVVEDAAIAYGYNNIERTIPNTNCTAKQLPLNELTDILRGRLEVAGFTECLTFALCSRDDVASKLRKNIEDIPAAHISNPKTLEFQLVRTTLLPGILKTIQSNRKMPVPLRLFEVTDVVLKDESKDVGCRNERRLCAIYYGMVSELEFMHGLLDWIMKQLEVKESDYKLVPVEDPVYLSGRCADVILRGQSIGRLGTVHPEVMENFELKRPCSSLEINIEYFV